MTALSQDQFHSWVLKGEDKTGKSYEWVKEGVEWSEEFRGLFNDITKNFAYTTEDIVARATTVLSELQNKSYAEIRKECGNGTCYTYALQILLASRSYFWNQTEVIDGILGPQTKEAVKKFQTTYNKTHIPLLDVDGLAGPATITALLGTAPTPSATTGTTTDWNSNSNTTTDNSSATNDWNNNWENMLDDDNNTTTNSTATDTESTLTAEQENQLCEIESKLHIPMDILQKILQKYRADSSPELIKKLMDPKTEVIDIDQGNKNWIVWYTDDNNKQKYIQIEYSKKAKILYQWDMKLKWNTYLADGEWIEYNLNDNPAYNRYDWDRTDGFPNWNWIIYTNTTTVNCEANKWNITKVEAKKYDSNGAEITSQRKIYRLTEAKELGHLTGDDVNWRPIWESGI
jgi:peptidoglycan hydrolase-like protein with peptidoglycan-binding domain